MTADNTPMLTDEEIDEIRWQQSSEDIVRLSIGTLCDQAKEANRLREALENLWTASRGYQYSSGATEGALSRAEAHAAEVLAALKEPRT